ncbi:MAG: hypothetical protein E7376_01220 [Clostridiales bacterium]|nr:hypothetical protein [Clostridiales bacterium]
MGIFDIFRKKQDKTKQAEITKPSPTIIEEEKAKEILDKAILEFFPKTGTWNGRCFDGYQDVYRVYLPCHLRDNFWMSKLLHNELLEKNIYIEKNVILKYMNNSETFAEKRHEYELEIVKWQINWMKKGGEGWCLPAGADEFSLLFDPDVDKIFRAGIIKTLCTIGMDKEVVIEGIEKYADLWRMQYMRRSFRNAYEPIAYLCKPIKQADPNHEKNYIKLRMYEYYTEHKEDVDKYGLVTPEMQITGDELKNLRIVLEKQNKQRQKEIDEWNKETLGNHTKYLKGYEK